METVTASDFERKILIVANDLKARDLMTAAIQSIRCQVMQTSSDSEAMKMILADTSIAAVLVDLDTPILNRLGFLNDIRSLKFGGPYVCFVSQRHQQDADFEQAFFEGLEAVFFKPLDQAELYRGMSLVVERPANHPERQMRYRLRNTRVQFINESTGAHGKGCVINISLNGMFICSLRNLPAGNQTIKFKFINESANPVLVSGQAIVNWARYSFKNGRPPGFGVEFVGLEPEATAAIANMTKEI